MICKDNYEHVLRSKVLCIYRIYLNRVSYQPMLRKLAIFDIALLDGEVLKNI